MPRKQWITHIHEDGRKGHAYGPYRTRREALATAQHWARYFANHARVEMVVKDTRWILPQFGRVIEIQPDA